MSYHPGIRDECIRAGLTVKVYPGWEKHGSSTFNPRGVVAHHTGPWSTVGGMVGLCIRGRADLPGPLAQAVLSPDAVVHLIAAGRANHAGTGGWQGLSGNSSVWGIEAIHSGSAATPWPAKQLEAYYRLVAAMCRYSKVDADRVCGHKEWAPTRKIDPISLPMSDFRRTVQGLLTNDTTPVPTPGAPMINRPPVMLLTLPGIDGYAVVSDDGGVFGFGDFPFLGSLGGVALSAPIVDAQAVMVGGAPGYYMMSRDGGLFAFGSARFHGRVEYKIPAMVRQLRKVVRRTVDKGEYLDGCPDPLQPEMKP